MESASRSTATPSSPRPPPSCRRSITKTTDSNMPATRSAACSRARRRLPIMERQPLGRAGQAGPPGRWLPCQPGGRQGCYAFFCHSSQGRIVREPRPELRAGLGSEQIHQRPPVCQGDLRRRSPRNGWRSEARVRVGPCRLAAPARPTLTSPGRFRKPLDADRSRARKRDGKSAP